MGIQGNEISFFTWDFKVCLRMFLGFLRFVPEYSITHYLLELFDWLMRTLTQFLIIVSHKLAGSLLTSKKFNAIFYIFCSFFRNFKNS